MIINVIKYIINVKYLKRFYWLTGSTTNCDTKSRPLFLCLSGGTGYCFISYVVVTEEISPIHVHYNGNPFHKHIFLEQVYKYFTKLVLIVVLLNCHEMCNRSRFFNLVVAKLLYIESAPEVGYLDSTPHQICT